MTASAARVWASAAQVVGVPAFGVSFKVSSSTSSASSTPVISFQA